MSMIFSRQELLNAIKKIDENPNLKTGICFPKK